MTKEKLLEYLVKRNKTLKSKFKRYERLYEALEVENPDIFFYMGLNFVIIARLSSIKKKSSEIKLYAKDMGYYTL